MTAEPIRPPASAFYTASQVLSGWRRHADSYGSLAESKLRRALAMERPGGGDDGLSRQMYDWAESIIKGKLDRRLLLEGNGIEESRFAECYAAKPMAKLFRMAGELQGETRDPDHEWHPLAAAVTLYNSKHGRNLSLSAIQHAASDGRLETIRPPGSATLTTISRIERWAPATHGGKRTKSGKVA